MKSMLEVFKQVIQNLEDHQIQYMVVGSIASIIYGEPRLTRDMDIVVELTPESTSELSKIFPSEAYYLPPFEILSQEVVNRGQFNILELQTMIKVDVMIRKNSPHALTEFSRMIKKEFLPGFNVNVAAPEDVIIKKLYFFKEGQSHKHIDDIRGILAHTEVDKEYISNWVEELNLSTEWQLANQS